jgi:hypothetical protein
MLALHVTGIWEILGVCGGRWRRCVWAGRGGGGSGPLAAATNGLDVPAARLEKGGRGDNHDTIRSENNDLVEDFWIRSGESGIGFAVGDAFGAGWVG